MMDLVIRNVRIASHTGVFVGSIAVKDGRIAAITSVEATPDAKRVIDGGGRVAIPGLIDSHVHFQDPGITHREDFECGTMAGAMGGVTTAISHPMNIPPIVDEASYNFTIDAYAGRGYIDYGIHGGGTSDNIGSIRELWQNTGATSIKMFMCFSVADFPYVKDDALYAICEQAAEMDAVVMIHAENNELIAMEEKRLLSEGRIDPMAHVESHSRVGELEAVKRALYFLEVTGARGVILHTCMTEALEEIASAKRRGVKVYAECCPHLLTFNEDDMMEYGPYLKFTPVMRDEANRQKLWQMLQDGYVDTIGSDHSPYTPEEKKRGMLDIWQAPNGIPGIQTTLPVLLDGVNKGLLSLERLVEVTSYNPSRVFGLEYCKGEIKVGLDADIVILDMDLEKEFTREEMCSKCKWSPYIQRRFKGWPDTTIVRGEVVVQNRKLIGKVGHGRYTPRRKDC